MSSDCRLSIKPPWAFSPDKQQGQSTDTRLWWGKVQCWLQSTKQGEWKACAQKTQIFWWLWGKCFWKPMWWRGCRVHDQLMHSSLIGWGWGNRMIQDSQTSAFWLYLVWGLCVGVQYAVNLLYLMGVLVSAK